MLQLGRPYTLEEEVKAHRSNIDVTDKDGNTALRLAAARCDHHAVILLLKAGANAKSRDHMVTSVLHEALRASSLQSVQVLLKTGADPYHVNLYGHSILSYVRGSDAGIIIQSIIKADGKVNAKEKAEGSPLHHYIYRGDVKAAKAILDLGADIDLLDRDGDSALIESICKDADDTTELLKPGQNGIGRMMMPFHHRYSEQGKQLSGRSSEQSPNITCLSV